MAVKVILKDRDIVTPDGDMDGVMIYEGQLWIMANDEDQTPLWVFAEGEWVGVTAHE